jgi:CheY-like chemotaxis protein
MARILVADDASDIRDVISMILERAGHDVVAVPDGAAAFDLHQQVEFDLIISDFSMPVLDGLELTRRVRANGRSTIPILLVTASASDHELAEARAAGVSGHLTKPFRIAELRDEVAALLGGGSGA